MNVPHDRVIIAGDVPSMTSDAVIVFKVPRIDGDRYLSSTSNIFAAMHKGEVSDDFIVMNDDFFVLEPWRFVHENRGPLVEQIDNPECRGDYRARMVSTLGLLRSVGITDPLFYGLHTPTVYNRAKLVEMMREYPMPRFKYLLRTLYNNLYPQPSIRRDDVKVKQWPVDGKIPAILSISDNVAALPEFRNWINTQFPVASKYEVI